MPIVPKRFTRRLAGIFCRKPAPRSDMHGQTVTDVRYYQQTVRKCTRPSRRLGTLSPAEKAPLLWQSECDVV